jgi:hypothetical protein
MTSTSLSTTACCVAATPPARAPRLTALLRAAALVLSRASIGRSGAHRRYETLAGLSERELRDIGAPDHLIDLAQERAARPGWAALDRWRS